MTWKPVQPLHAIERVRVVVVFASPLPLKLVQRVGDDLEPVRVNLQFAPRQEAPSEGFSIVAGPTGPQFQPVRTAGWRFLRLNEAQQAIESIDLDQNEFSYSTSDYSRWPEFLSRFRDVCSPALDRLIDTTDIQSIALEYFDRFLSEKEGGKPSPKELIDPSLLILLNDEARSGEQLWHLHRGWFETNTGAEFLVNQNIDAQDGVQANGAKLRTLAILTRVDRRNSDGKPLDGFALDPLLGQMHDAADSLFRMTITENARRMVGMTG